jgi:drug/metabolite transporter (DMT)-like permease
MTVFLGLFVYVVLAITLRRQATVNVGLSKPWFRKRRRAILISWGLSLLGIAVMAGSFFVLSDPHGHPAWAGWGLLLGFLVLLGGIIHGLIAARIVTPARITEDYVWLKGVHPGFLADFPEWPYQP